MEFGVMEFGVELDVEQQAILRECEETPGFELKREVVGGAWCFVWRVQIEGLQYASAMHVAEWEASGRKKLTMDGFLLQARDSIVAVKRKNAGLNPSMTPEEMIEDIREREERRRT